MSSCVSTGKPQTSFQGPARRVFPASFHARCHLHQTQGYKNRLGLPEHERDDLRRFASVEVSGAFRATWQVSALGFRPAQEWPPLLRCSPTLILSRGSVFTASIAPRVSSTRPPQGAANTTLTGPFQTDRHSSVASQCPHSMIQSMTSERWPSCREPLPQPSLLELHRPTW